MFDSFLVVFHACSSLAIAEFELTVMRTVILFPFCFQTNYTFPITITLLSSQLHFWSVLCTCVSHHNYTFVITITFLVCYLSAIFDFPQTCNPRQFTENIQQIAEIDFRPACSTSKFTENIQQIAEIDFHPACNTSPFTENMQQIAEIKICHRH